ncbi:MAG TPA: murein biosynthesis integral membrane protein MurJ [Gemmatimonadales bacterium]|nr:murein biosynthesis integral membrane protein MurJ [Gemmatimonadales bacterium]
MAAGILLSRIVGLVRNRTLTHYLGVSDAADALAAAFRIPNLLQNLFGEGALSASFVPVYAALRAKGEAAEATRLAGATAAVLALLTSLLVLVGILAAPVLVDLLAPGFQGEKRALTVTLVRILFPGVGALVLAAWCLGVLSSHRRFFLSYAAPVVWNVAIIVAVLLGGSAEGEARLAITAAWGAVAGSVLQVAIQLPGVSRLVRPIGAAIDLGSPHLRTVARNFGPALISRGVLQISAYVDTLVASLLPAGSAALLYFGQMVSMLPVSLFGMAVSAAELPELASATAAPEAATRLRERLRSGLRQIAYFVVPSAAAFVAHGDVIAAALYQSGRFTADDSRRVWAILAASAVGLVATTAARLYASTYYALHDTRTPMRFALARVGLGSAMGIAGALWLPARLGLPAWWGVAALPLASGMAGWVELLLLRLGIERRIGRSRVPVATTSTLWGAAAAAAASGWAVDIALGMHPPLVRAIFVLGTFGLVYLGGTAAAGVPEARGVLAAASRLGRTR